MVYQSPMLAACKRRTAQNEQKPVSNPERLNFDSIDAFSTAAVINLAEAITRRK